MNESHPLLTEQEFKRLTDALLSPVRYRRESARNTILAFSNEQRAVWLAAMLRTKPKRSNSVWLAVLMGVCAILIPTLVFTGDIALMIGLSIPTLFVALLVNNCLSRMLIHAPAASVRALVAQVIEESQDPQVILPILRSLPTLGEPKMYPLPATGSTSALLHRLIPLVSQEVVQPWTTQDRKLLLPFVNYPATNPLLTLESLRILSYIGDNEDLMAVINLRERIRYLRDIRDDLRDAIYRASVNCTSEISIRLSNLAVSRTLLRASYQPSESKPEQLLRAAEVPGETPALQLLRASENGPAV